MGMAGLWPLWEDLTLWPLWEDLTFSSRGPTVPPQPQAPFGRAVEWLSVSVREGQDCLFE